jgi:hypothetical protein
MTQKNKESKSHGKSTDSITQKECGDTPCVSDEDFIKAPIDSGAAVVYFILSAEEYLKAHPSTIGTVRFASIKGKDSAEVARIRVSFASAPEEAKQLLKDLQHDAEEVGLRYVGLNEVPSWMVEDDIAARKENIIRLFVLFEVPK